MPWVDAYCGTSSGSAPALFPGPELDKRQRFRRPGDDSRARKRGILDRRPKKPGAEKRAVESERDRELRE
jgi:hypothetical protein